MSHGFVTKKVAMRLKELGYDQECFTYYTSSSPDDAPRPMCEPRLWDWNSGVFIDTHGNVDVWSAPTWTETAAFIYQKSGGVSSIQFGFDFKGAVAIKYDPDDKSEWRATPAMTIEDAFLKAMEGLTQ